MGNIIVNITESIGSHLIKGIELADDYIIYYYLNPLDIKIQKILNSKSKTYIEETINAIDSSLLSNEGLEFFCLIREKNYLGFKFKFIFMYLMNIFIRLELNEKFSGLEILVPLFKKLGDKIKNLFQNESKHDFNYELFFKGKEKSIQEFKNRLKEGYDPFHNLILEEPINSVNLELEPINSVYLFFVFSITWILFSAHILNQTFLDNEYILLSLLNFLIEISDKHYFAEFEEFNDKYMNHIKIYLQKNKSEFRQNGAYQIINFIKFYGVCRKIFKNVKKDKNQKNSTNETKDIIEKSIREKKSVGY